MTTMIFQHSLSAFAFLAALGSSAYAAGPTPAPAGATSASAAKPHPPATHPQVTELAPVKVRMHPVAPVRGDTLAAYGSASLHDTPAAVTVIGQQQIADNQIQTLAELANLDAALGDGYAPIGYIQNLTIRGYPLDLATGYRVNNLTVTGEQFIAFEDKQEVQILQGLAGLDAGVMEPGGVVNFVSKRPANVRSITLGTDAYGSRSVALDVGRWVTPTFGVRVNIAAASMRAFVDHTHGQRWLAALATDWKISPRATLQLDSDFTGYSQLSVSAYQLLGGVTLPEDVDRHQLLAYEPWQQPTSIHANNSSAHLDWKLDDRWTARFAAGHSRSVVQDNVSFAYGCTGAPGCTAGPTPAAWFAPNGNYDIWDYRSPNETYLDDEGRATLEGQLDSGVATQDLSLGVDTLHHTVALPDEVFDFVGYANIDERTPPVYPPSPSVPGPLVQRLNSWEQSAFALDRVQFGTHWQVLAGGHFTSLTERAWDASGSAEPTTRMQEFLPQAALLWQPTAALTTYLSASRGLSLGEQAPYWTTNAGDTLAPRLSSQVEAGAKLLWGPRLDLEAALYRIHEPYQFAQPDGTGNFLFVQRGEEVHSGLELSANGEATADLGVHASLAFIRARAQDTGVPDYEGHQVANVPDLSTALALDYRLPALPQLVLSGGWSYASRKAATATGNVYAPAYNVFNAGLRYNTSWGDHPIVWRFRVDNLFNRFYWRYTGSDGNDSYLLPGAPRLAWLSVEVQL